MRLADWQQVMVITAHVMSACSATAKWQLSYCSCISAPPTTIAPWICRSSKQAVLDVLCLQTRCETTACLRPWWSLGLDDSIVKDFSWCVPRHMLMPRVVLLGTNCLNSTAACACNENMRCTARVLVMKLLYHVCPEHSDAQKPHSLNAVK
jgi:hypothetical protein